MNIAVIVVSWNVRDLLAACLASLQREAADWRDGRLELWVADNASHDGSAALVRERFPSVHLLETGRNAGFGGGFNAGLAALPDDVDAVLLLNPDAEVAPGCIAALAAMLQAHPDAGMVGPMLLEADGRVQPSRRRFPRLRTAFLESTILQTAFPHNSELARYYCLDTADTAEQRVDWLMGAALLFRRAALRQVGGFDEAFFLYFEETDWCLRAARMGWSAYYQPAARVTHLGGRSSEQVMTVRHVHFVQSKVRYYQKHFGRWQSALVRRFLMLNYALHIAEDAVKLLAGHKRAMRRERIALYGHVLRHAFSR